MRIMAGRTIIGLALAICAFSTGCGSSNPAPKQAAPGRGRPQTGGQILAENTKHPLAKFIEIAGFRITESKPGRLRVEFGVINHSDADVSDLALNVDLRPTTAKDDEPGFCALTIKIPSLAPRSLKDVSGECPTKLRVYELPDWQFIRPTFQITAPPM
jgi:hypothetical protein